MTGMTDGYPDLAGLALLAEVDLAGSVGAAAARFGISQPAASQRIRALERHLAVALVERRTTGSRLTPEGTVVVEWAAPLLAAAAEFHAGVDTLSDQGGHRVRVAASLTVADYLLPRWLVALRQLLPDVTVSLRPGNSEAVVSAVRSREVDLGFVEGPDAPPGVRARVVADDDLLVVVSPRHPWAARTEPIGAAQLARAPLVLREQGSGTRHVLDRALAAHGLTADPLMHLGSTTAIKHAVRDGGYATVISRLAVADELAAHDLVAVPVAGIDLHRRIRAIWRASTPPREAAGALLAISATSA
jgi:molybdate transport repressor ModE-like protein